VINRRDFLTCIPFTGALFTVIDVRASPGIPTVDPHRQDSNLLDMLEQSLLESLAKFPNTGPVKAEKAQWVCSMLLQDSESPRYWDIQKLVEPAVLSFSRSFAYQPAYLYPGNEKAVSGSLQRIVWYNHCPFGIVVTYDGAKQGHVIMITHFTGRQ